MRPFFEIFLAQPSSAIKELVLTCVGGLAGECLQTMRSGWNAVFQILAHSSREGRQRGVELLVTVASNGFQVLSHSHILHLISVAMAFVVNGREIEICGARPRGLEKCAMPERFATSSPTFRRRRHA
jgi:hypothetical protein